SACLSWDGILLVYNATLVQTCYRSATSLKIISYRRNDLSSAEVRPPSAQKGSGGIAVASFFVSKVACPTAECAFASAMPLTAARKLTSLDFRVGSSYSTDSARIADWSSPLLPP